MGDRSHPRTPKSTTDLDTRGRRYPGDMGQLLVGTGLEVDAQLAMIAAHHSSMNDAASEDSQPLAAHLCIWEHVGMTSKQDQIWDLERELREERKARTSDQERYEKHLEGRRSRIEELEAKIVQRDSHLEEIYGSPRGGGDWGDPRLVPGVRSWLRFFEDCNRKEPLAWTTVSRW